MTKSWTKPRVLLILHELSLSGAPKLILDLFDEIADEIEVRFVSVLGGQLEDRCRAMGKLDILPRMPMGGPLASKLGPTATKQIVNGLRLYLSPLSADIERWKPDIIYYNSVWSCAAAEVLAIPNKPALMHVHELEIGIAMAVRQYRSQLIDTPDHYIAVSNAVKRALEVDHSIPPERITTIHGAIPDRDLSVTEPSEVVDDNHNPIIVGGCGTSYWRKGVFLWLQVAQQVIEKVGADAVKFQWVGAASADEMIMCVESARKLGVLENVEFIATTPDPLSFFKKFDIFAMTSIEDPCPIVVLENMNFGTPVVCFKDGGGTIEEVGESGIAIDHFSTTAMADAVVELVSDKVRRRQLGEATAKRVRSEFVTSVQAPKILKVIQDVANYGK